MKTKLRPLGKNLLDLEEVITEMVEVHDLQHGDVLALVKSYLDIHHPHAQEEYEDGSDVEFYYGPKRSKK